MVLIVYEVVQTTILMKLLLERCLFFLLTHTHLIVSLVEKNWVRDGPLTLALQWCQVR